MIIQPSKLSSFSIILLLLSESIGLLSMVFPILKGLVFLLDIGIFFVGMYLFLLIMVSLINKNTIFIFLILFGVLISIFIILSLNINLFGLTADGVKRSAFNIYISVFLKYLIYLGIFSFYNPSIKEFKWMKITLLIGILIPICLISESYLSINYNLFQDSSNRAWTLTYSDTLCLFTFLFYPKFYRFKNLLILLLLFSVFLVGSRTNLVIALFVILINFLFSKKNFFRTLVYVIAILTGLLVFLNNIEFISELVKTDHSSLSRLFDLFLSNEDLSFLERKYFEKKGVEDIINSPVFGKFGGQLYVFGITDQLSPRWGGYIHNYLSFIRQFGLIGLNLLFIYLFASFKVLKETKLKIFIIYLLLMYFLSRSFVYPYLFIVIGLWLKQHYRYRLLFRV